MNKLALGLGVSALTMVATSVMAAAPQPILSAAQPVTFTKLASNTAEDSSGRYIIVFKENATFSDSTALLYGLAGKRPAMVFVPVCRAKVSD